jgi:hypothetical protein
MEVRKRMRRELDGKRKQGKYMKIKAGGWNGINEGKKKCQLPE